MFSGMDMFHSDPAQPLKNAGEELNHLQQIMIYLICPRREAFR